jgi:EAL domain-containing protein (putative c-di-GMP-specific phosphodiesterase class I)
VALSLSQIAEDLVRAGDGDTARWQGITLRSYLQPIYSAREARCVGFEALARATDASGAPLRTARLFDEAYARGDGVLLDWICRALHLRRFARLDSGERRLFLNVHPEAAVRDARAVREFASLAGFYGLACERLCIEILETPCADEPGLRDAVDAYRELGVTVALDDFGLGRSNFDRIVALRPDVVKIDRGLLTRAVGDTKARRMLPAVIELLHETGAEVLVEGIESASEALLAIESDADALQGFHFARPGANPPDESLTQEILAGLLRMRGQPRLAVVG